MSTASPTVYADATALIGLARINRLDLLALLSGSVAVPSDRDDLRRPGSRP